MQECPRCGAELIAVVGCDGCRGAPGLSTVVGTEMPQLWGRVECSCGL